MNKQFQKVIEGLEHHAGIADWGCWNDDDDSSNNGDVLPNEYCPYFDEDNCGTALLTETINLLKEYDSALRGMVYQYCTTQKWFLKGKECDEPNQKVFFHNFISAGEEAFAVLGIKNGDEVTEDFIWS